MLIIHRAYFVPVFFDCFASYYHRRGGGGTLGVKLGKVSIPPDDRILKESTDNVYTSASYDLSLLSLVLLIEQGELPLRTLLLFLLLLLPSHYLFLLFLFLFLFLFLLLFLLLYLLPLHSAAILAGTLESLLQVLTLLLPYLLRR